MAQADDSAPRKTTTYKRFEGMASQNERYNTKPDEMFWLENIMRVSPKRLHSVPGPTANLFNPLQPCVIDSPREHQSLAPTACSNIQSGFPPGTISNARASWGRVENGIVIAAVVSAANPIPSIEVLEINVKQGTVIQSLTPIATPFVGNLMQCGHSDEQSYAFFGGVGGGDSAMWYFSWPQQTVTRFLSPDGFAETAKRWAKNGAFYYIIQAASNALIVQQFSFPGILQPDGTYTGTFVQENATTFAQPTPSDPHFTALDLQATDAFVYVLVLKNPPDSGEPPGQIYKLNVSDLSVADSFQFDYFTTTNPTNNASPLLMSVASDDLVYILRNANLPPLSSTGRLEFGYVDWVTHSYEYIDSISAGELTCSDTIGTPTFVFENGQFYYGGSGAPLAGGLVDIVAIGPVDCPGLFHGGLTISYADFEFPDASLNGQVTYAAFTVPDTNAGFVTQAGFMAQETQDAGFVLDAYFEVPGITPEADMVVVKSADQNITNSTTLTDDTELTVAVGANETWVVYFTLDMQGDDSDISVIAPSGSTGEIIDISNTYSGYALGTRIGSFSPTIIHLSVSVVTSSTSGNITFQFSQHINAGTPTTCKANSNMIAFKKV